MSKKHGVDVTKFLKLWDSFGRIRKSLMSNLMSKTETEEIY
jgi:hypothetical protein